MTLWSLSRMSVHMWIKGRVELVMFRTRSWCRFCLDAPNINYIPSYLTRKRKSDPLCHQEVNGEHVSLFKPVVSLHISSQSRILGPVAPSQPATTHYTYKDVRSPTMLFYIEVRHSLYGLGPTNWHSHAASTHTPFASWKTDTHLVEATCVRQERAALRTDWDLACI